MNMNNNRTAIDHQFPPHKQSEVTKAILEELLPSVVKWNDEFTTPAGEKGTGTKWKQYLKNKFVYLTRLKDPWQRPGDWDRDISIAVNETVASLCPNWKSNSKDRDMYNSINTFVHGIRTSPRQRWLKEKAYAWLKCFTPQNLRNKTWYPARAIRVAYELFLSGGSGKFESFMNYLKKNGKNHPKIQQLIVAHGSCALYDMRTAWPLLSLQWLFYVARKYEHKTKQKETGK